MPGWSIGLPAKECKTGGKLQKLSRAASVTIVTRSRAATCLRLFKMHNTGGWQLLRSSRNGLTAMAHLINSKKPDVFRWHDSGDVQDLDHLKKIYAVCRLTPGKRHWLPTREAWIKDHLTDKPNNLVIRFSAPMVNQRAPASWPNSSEVVDKVFTCARSITARQ